MKPDYMKFAHQALVESECGELHYRNAAAYATAFLGYNPSGSMSHPENNMSCMMKTLVEKGLAVKTTDGTFALANKKRWVELSDNEIALINNFRNGHL